MAQSGNNLRYCQSCQNERQALQESTLDECSEVVCLGCCFCMELNSGYGWIASGFFGVLCAEVCKPFLLNLSVDLTDEQLKDRKCHHTDNLTPRFNVSDSSTRTDIAADAAGATGSVDDRPQPRPVTVQPEENSDRRPRPIRRGRNKRRR
ncbi:hypothetical protein [Endozoicomonas acroporae]|uniref:hypothetical protein n=1 Tax=Endozoicomonas acroporae TaxID=1701104 RepID=UPI0013D5AA06|nr:hypothetical protein [Endozoicomonas acroporae]